MLSPSSCHSCVWVQASPLNFTNVAASTMQLALSLFCGTHTAHLSLWFMYVDKKAEPPLLEMTYLVGIWDHWIWDHHQNLHQNDIPFQIDLLKQLCYKFISILQNYLRKFEKNGLLLLQGHLANQNAPDNKNAATFWRRRPLAQ